MLTFEITYIREYHEENAENHGWKRTHQVPAMNTFDAIAHLGQVFHKHDDYHIHIISVAEV